jgi:hypothetical protein
MRESIPIRNGLRPLISPCLQHALNPAFRIDQEVRSGNDAISFIQARNDLVVIAAAGADFDLPRLELSISVIDEDDVLVTRGNHGTGGYG